MNNVADSTLVVRIFPPPSPFSHPMLTGAQLVMELISESAALRVFMSVLFHGSAQLGS